jgi:hypothetical protein
LVILVLHHQSMQCKQLRKPTPQMLSVVTYQHVFEPCNTSVFRRYEASVRACEVRLAREAEELEEEVDPGELLLERLDAGLFTLQCALVAVAALWSTADAGLRRRLLACLHQKGQSLEMVR